MNNFHKSILLTAFLTVLLTACSSATVNARGTPKLTNTAPTLPTSTQKSTITTSPTDQLEVIETRTHPVDGMVMVYIPGGSFQMGSTKAEIEDAIALCQKHYNICNQWYYQREDPIHSVTLNGFWLYRTEVTNAQYKLCVEAGTCTVPSTCKKGTPTYGDPGKFDHPVVCVSWDEAQAYCAWIGGRLPTEAEWEYAARGETRAIFPWGNDFNGTRLNYCDANCSLSHRDLRYDDGYPLTAPSGSYLTGTSWSGALNMGGNVSEWVADWLGEYPTGAISNPTGPVTGTEKLVKGCSWYYHPTYCRGAARASVNPDTRYDYFGFRCVVPETKDQGDEASLIIGGNSIPAGGPPTLDGTISPGEWDKARTETFSDGSKLYIMEGDGYLYLGLRGETPELITGNIFLHRGDQVSVLHSSAALGTAIYQQNGNHWAQVQNFNWRCRKTGTSQAAIAERGEFLKEEGWLAANARLGTPNELEFQIKMTSDLIHLAVTFLRTSNLDEKIVWPLNVVDDCITSTQGGFPEQMDLSLEQWAQIEFKE